MALKANKSVEAAQIELYCGIATVKVLAINPNLAGMKKLFPNYKKEEEPNYVTTDDKGIKKVRISFYCQTIAEKCNGIDTIIPVTFFIEGRGRQSQAGAYQVIDKYGRTAWATEEVIKSGAIPEHSKGKYNISEGYRKAYVGEEELINFLKAWLNIKNVDKWDNGKVVGLIDDPSEAECYLEDMKALVNGNVKELKDALAMQPENECKILCGVKTNDKGQQNQAVYIDKDAFLKLSNTNLTKINNSVKNKVAAGGLKSTDFTGDNNHSPIVAVFKKYEPKASNLTPSDDPLNAPQSKGSEDEWNL